MTFSMPQTYLIGLTSLLLIISILVGRQLLKVRKAEIQLVKLEKNASSDSENAENLYELASVQLKKRLYPQAIISLKQALKNLKEEPSEAKAIIENALGFSLAAQDNFKEAVEHYEKAIRAKSDYPVALNNLAFAKQKLLLEDEAFNLYKKVLNIDPKNKTAKRQLEKISKLKQNSSSNIVYKKGF